MPGWVKTRGVWLPCSLPWFLCFLGFPCANTGGQGGQASQPSVPFMQGASDILALQHDGLFYLFCANLASCAYLQVAPTLFIPTKKEG